MNDAGSLELVGDGEGDGEDDPGGDASGDADGEGFFATDSSYAADAAIS